MPSSRYEINQQTWKGQISVKGGDVGMLALQIHDDSQRHSGSRDQTLRQRSQISDIVEIEGPHINITNPEFKALPGCF